MAERFELISPDGRPWTAGTVIEANDLLAQGYRRKDDAPPSEPEPAEPTPNHAGGVPTPERPAAAPSASWPPHDPWGTGGASWQ